jgi:hypothetical protein
MFIYAFICTVIADTAVVALTGHSHIATSLVIGLVVIPYLFAVRHYLKLRQAEQDAAANP